MKIKDLKEKGKKYVRKNYSACLITCIVMIFIVSSPLSITQSISVTNDFLEFAGNVTGFESINNFADKVIDAENKIQQFSSIGDDSSEGVLSEVYFSKKNAGTTAGGIFLILNNLIFGGKVSKVVISILGVIAAFLFAVFVKNILRVGYARFFVDNMADSKTRMSTILFIFRMKKVKHCAWIMALRIMFISLWFLTIVGGIIKFYSYRMIPYILAENPNISRKKAFELSIEMMKGNKFRAFMLDVSFLPWLILSVFTFGIVGFFWVEPYMRSTFAVFYTDVKISCGYESFFALPAPPELKIRIGYKRVYTIWNLILMFFAFAVVGWIWECALQIAMNGYFSNRGSLYGPWIPIYGFGGVGVIILLKRFADRPVLTFILSMVFCGVLEGGTAWFLDVAMGREYWSYHGYYFNIHGYVCLEGLLVFGLGGCVFIYILAPLLDDLFNKIPRNIRVGICLIFATAFLSDAIYALFNPHMGKGVGSYTQKIDGSGS